MLSRFPILFYRFYHQLHRLKLFPLAELFVFFNRILFGAYIPAGCQIGLGVRLGYGGSGVVIHQRCIIGEGCVIGPGVVLGGRSRKPNVPIVESGVYLGAGAKLLGDITIGEGSLVAPNSVVIASVPARSIVVGVPARVVRSDIEIRDYV